MFSKILFTGLLLLSAFFSHAKIWRVNNNPGVATDFTTFDACVASVSVLNGDTVHLEASATGYTNSSNINKRLTIIGTGYFLSGAGANTGLQATPNSAFFNSSIQFDSLASGSKFLGIDGNSAIWLDPRADNITFERCRFGSISWNTQAASILNRAQNIVFNKCYFNSSAPPAQFYFDNLQITNCIITGPLFFNPSNISNALIRNNVFQSSITLTNSYFSNNIVLNISSGSFSVTSSSIKNNIAEFAGVLPVGSGNQNGISEVSLFLGPTGNSTDGQWQLAVSSPAINAGETVNTITPDCGAFGTADPYRLSGIPPVPTIYSLTVPGSVPIGQPLNITVSTRSNN